MAIRAMSWASVGPHAFRKPVGRRSKPGAFHAPVLRRIDATSSDETCCSRVNFSCVASCRLKFVMSPKSASKLGKNL